MLTLTAMIWGAAFVAQSESMKYIGPLTFAAVRMLLGGLVLIPAVIFFDGRKPEHLRIRKGRRDIFRTSVRGGIEIGVFLCTANLFQQYGLLYTTVGKSGFITAMYVVFVPLMSVFLHKKIDPRVWACVALAIAGFYLLSIKSGFSIGKGDVLTFFCAVFFSLQILAIDRYLGRDVDGVLMSCVQFLFSGAVSFVLMLIFEEPSLPAIYGARYTILYSGVLSSGVAYTLQILGQQRTEPAVATLIMSLESVFAALAGWLILRQAMTPREIAGAAMVFAAVVLAQLWAGRRERA